jgi:hypothetical protein
MTDQQPELLAETKTLIDRVTSQSLTQEEIGLAIESDQLNSGEKRLLKFQYRQIGDFFKYLFEAMHRADFENVLKLAEGFPAEMCAVTSWINDKNNFFAERIAYAITTEKNNRKNKETEPCQK